MLKGVALLLLLLVSAEGLGGLFRRVVGKVTGVANKMTGGIAGKVLGSGSGSVPPSSDSALSGIAAKTKKPKKPKKRCRGSMGDRGPLSRSCLSAGFGDLPGAGLAPQLQGPPV